MIKSKTIDFLKVLTENELNSFKQFLYSPYFNKNQKIIKLFEYLIKFYPDFENEELTKENLFKLLFPQKNYKDNEIRRNLSDLLSLGKNFLVHERLSGSNKFEKVILLLEELSNKRLDKLFNIESDKIKRSYRAINEIEQDYFLNNYRLEEQYINHNLRMGQPKINVEPTVNSLTYLICYALITALKINQNILVDKISFGSAGEKNTGIIFLQSIDFNNILEYLKYSNPSFYPIIAIYYYRTMIAADNDDDNEYYMMLKKQIEKNISNFSRREKYNLMLFLENSCAQKIHTGKTEYRQELFNVHKKMLESGLYTYSEASNFNPIRFRMIVNNTIILKEFEWTEEFIKIFSKSLPYENREVLYSYTLALTKFKQGDFQESINLISKTKTDTPILKYDIRTLKLQLYYELRHISESFYLIDSYKHTIHSDTSSPEWSVKRFTEFINILQKLLKITEKGLNKSGEVEILMKEIETNKEICEKLWLLDKLQEIVRNKR